MSKVVHIKHISSLQRRRFSEGLKSRKQECGDTAQSGSVLWL